MAFTTPDPLDPADRGTSFGVEISGDGRKGAFVSNANNLGDPAGHVHVHLRNLDDVTTKLPVS